MRRVWQQFSRLNPSVYSAALRSSCCTVLIARFDVNRNKLRLLLLLFDVLTALAAMNALARRIRLRWVRYNRPTQCPLKIAPSRMGSEPHLIGPVHTSNIVEATFDFVAENGNIVAKNGNNVEAAFDTVQRIVQLVAFDSVASTLLLVWTGLHVVLWIHMSQPLNSI